MRNLALGRLRALIKKAVVAARQKSSPLSLVAVALGSSILLFAANVGATTVEKATPSPNDPGEPLRRELFEGTLNTPSCRLIKTDPRGTIALATPLTATLQAQISSIIAAVRTKDDKALQPLFHSRLNVSLAALGETFGKLDFTYGAPYDVSIYRLWALNTIDGSPVAQSCPGDQVKVFPQYGYPLQFGLWLQVMGQKEIGRIFISLVPVQSKWVIGAFRTQQWTHAGKDYAEWADLAAKASHASFKQSAFIKYDLAAKLADGGTFVELAVQPDLLKARDAVMTPAQWSEEVKAAVKGYDVVYVATILVVGGDGILLRLRSAKDLSLEEMTAQCKGIAKNLSNQPWTGQVTGIRCSFLLPGEDPKKDGAMGSLYTELHP